MDMARCQTDSWLYVVDKHKTASKYQFPVNQLLTRNGKLRKWEQEVSVLESVESPHA